MYAQLSTRCTGPVPKFQPTDNSFELQKSLVECRQTILGPVTKNFYETLDIWLIVDNIILCNDKTFLVSLVYSLKYLDGIYRYFGSFIWRKSRKSLCTSSNLSKPFPKYVEQIHFTYLHLSK